MPRVSLRRAFLYFGAVASVSLLLVAVHAPGGTFIPLTSSGLRRAATGYSGDRPVIVLSDDQLQSGARDSQSRQVAGPDEAVLTHPRGLKEGLHDGGDAAVDGEENIQNIGHGEDGKAPEERRLYVRDPPTPVVPANHTVLLPHQRPWYMKEGKRLAESIPGERKLMLWPNEDASDRIMNQLLYKPPPPPPQDVDHPDIGDSDKSQPSLKKILLYNGVAAWGLKAGRGQFLKLKCPVDTCVITTGRGEAANADAILFKDHFSLPQYERDMNQVWIMYMLECPLHTQHFAHSNVFNWTATYRHDSDLVAPYEKYVYHDPLIKQMDQPMNYAANKTKKVAWFVSNCGARNNRMQYAKELSRYISVDIYGACGRKKCPRSSSSRCFDMLNKDYKFYLAFENSNCRDYITEKFFVNGLSHHILPIVMGAHPDDYARAAPYKSYIHVDDFASPKALADYLHLLDQNPDLYNEYFRWKGTGEFINTYFMCRMCALLHDETHAQHYQDINQWWRGEGTCTSGSWRTQGKMVKGSKQGGANKRSAVVNTSAADAVKSSKKNDSKKPGDTTGGDDNNDNNIPLESDGKNRKTYN